MLLLGGGLAALSAMLLPAVGVHIVPEGHVGIYWRGGALLERVTGPGFHLMLPFVTSHAHVQVTVQTDKVVNIPCGTSGGTIIFFDRVEVVNQLHKDAVHAIVKNYTIDYDKTWVPCAVPSQPESSKLSHDGTALLSSSVCFHASHTWCQWLFSRAHPDAQI